MDYQTQEDMRRALVTETGDAISRWALLEGVLVDLFAFSLGIRLPFATVLISTHRTFSGQLDLVDAAMREKLGARPEIKFWTSLVEYIRELSGDRNYIAHTPIVITGPGIQFQVGPQTIHSVTQNQKYIPFSIEEVRECRDDFQHAANRLLQFLFHLTGRAPLPEKFGSPVVRRRPPKNERRARRKQAPKHRPDSSQE